MSLVQFGLKNAVRFKYYNYYIIIIIIINIIIVYYSCNSRLVNLQHSVTAMLNDFELCLPNTVLVVF